MTESHDVVWVFHLLGGARAVWGDHGRPAPVQIEPEVLSGQTLEFEGASFSQVAERCSALGFQIIGAALYTNQRELSGILPARWRPLHYMPNSAWFCSEEKDKWSEMAHAAQKKDMGRLWDCSARISYQIETCIARLQDISDRYAAQQFGRRKAIPKSISGWEFVDTVDFSSVASFLCGSLYPS
jgi:hypothetical protein